MPSICRGCCCFGILVLELVASGPSPGDARTMFSRGGAPISGWCVEPRCALGGPGVNWTGTLQRTCTRTRRSLAWWASNQQTQPPPISSESAHTRKPNQTHRSHIHVGDGRGQKVGRVEVTLEFYNCWVNGGLGAGGLCADGVWSRLGLQTSAVSLLIAFSFGSANCCCFPPHRIALPLGQPGKHQFCICSGAQKLAGRKARGTEVHGKVSCKLTLWVSFWV